MVLLLIYSVYAFILISIQVFTDSLSLTYYLYILRFIYPIPFPIDCVINQFTKGAQGLHTRTVQLRGLATRRRTQHAHLSRRVLVGGEGEKRFGIFRPQGLPAIPVLPHLAAQMGKWRPEERAWLSRRGRRGGGGFCAVPGGCEVGADRAGGLRAGAARHVPRARQLPAWWDPRHPRWLLQRGWTHPGRDRNWGNLQGPVLPSAQTVEQVVRKADPSVGRSGRSAPAAFPAPHLDPSVIQRAQSLRLVNSATERPENQRGRAICPGLRRGKVQVAEPSQPLSQLGDGSGPGSGPGSGKQ